ncbi:Hypothetical protein PBC10988_18000 [Planctomycetales bacterium 10988]|nr:Hypothetical protein PBC10988_18000 [Planctomycetales bacterium 10988]
MSFVKTMQRILFGDKSSKQTDTANPPTSQPVISKKKPKARIAPSSLDATLLTAIRSHQVSTILEIGLGDGKRAGDLIQTAQTTQNSEKVSYIGIDPFDMRSSEQPPLKLIKVYQALRPTGAKVQLVPGDLLSAITNVANQLPPIDLLLISADQQTPQLEEAWLFFPRFLAPEAQILLEVRSSPSVESDKKQQTTWKKLTVEEINQLAEVAWKYRRKAA